MGVPTLTLTGDRLIGLQGASLLAAAGLSDWVAATPAQYVDKALAFSRDLPALAGLRAVLRAQVLASPLFDAPRFARNFEDAVWTMWQRRRSSAG
jgi:predicted O-linked N-acetylglucosamine transferase (SPINDLY family)